VLVRPSLICIASWDTCTCIHELKSMAMSCLRRHADTKHMVAADLGASAGGFVHDGASADVLALATSPVDPLFVSSTAIPGAFCCYCTGLQHRCAA
jgi:hypothetical protein